MKLTPNAGVFIVLAPGGRCLSAALSHKGELLTSEDRGTLAMSIIGKLNVDLAEARLEIAELKARLADHEQAPKSITVTGPPNGE